MIKKIIALRGRGDIGKTTTINLIPAILTSSGWILVSHVPHGNRIDRTDVYKNIKDNRLLGVASAGAMAPIAAGGGGTEILNLIRSGATYTARSTWNAAKLYHNAVGMRGGYANTGLNWINQSYLRGGGGNYFSFEGKSLTGLIVAGSFRFNSTIIGQVAGGSLDSWGSVNYSNGGLILGGYASGDYSFKQALALSLVGGFNAIYMGAPLSKSGLVNHLIGNMLAVPGQKAIINNEE